jgi:hypothetical protein
VTQCSVRAVLEALAAPEDGTASFFETLVTAYQNARRYITEAPNLQQTLTLLKKVTKHLTAKCGSTHDYNV